LFGVMKYDGLLPGDQVRYGEFADKVELVEWTDGEILLGLKFRTESGQTFDRYDSWGGGDFEVLWRPRVPWHIDISFRAWLTSDIDEFGITYVPAERVNYWKPNPVNHDNFKIQKILRNSFSRFVSVGRRSGSGSGQLIGPRPQGEACVRIESQPGSTAL
jgi:hypothetical protein